MEERMVAPVVDRLLNYFERSHMNPSVPSEQVKEAMELLFSVLKPLMPLAENEEAKQLWLRIPRGTIDDYDCYEELLEWDEVKNRDEYEQRWLQEYPDEYVWYSLVIAECLEHDGFIRYRGISLGDNSIISAHMQSKTPPDIHMSDDAAIQLCSLIIPAVKESLCLLREGTYNKLVETSLPYKFRTGVIKRSVMNEHDPDMIEYVRDGIQPEILDQFRQYLRAGKNDETKIHRLSSMTANDFFHACSLGYKACGFDVKDQTEVDQYFAFGDGRDEGLTGRGHGLNASPGIDFNDSNAWDQWYFHREQHGGYPWEVVAGGNSTHVDLFVCHDRWELEWQVKRGKITREEADAHSCGYYFEVNGKYRPKEVIQFYVALKAEGLPVILRDAEEILARFDATDYVGIVPHHIATRYCEHRFPQEYGHIIDFMHVYEEEMEQYGEQIKWLPESPARLTDET